MSVVFFLSSSEKYGDEHGGGADAQNWRKKISVHRGDANWITSGSTPEEIVVYGDELGLGKQALMTVSVVRFFLW